MPNGAVARLPLPEHSAPILAKTQGDKPDVPIEVTIGTAVADAAVMLSQAMLERHAGRLCAETKAAGGERIARLYALQQDVLGKIDFPATVRREGKAQLRRYLDAEFYSRHSAEQGDAVLDELITGLLDIVAKVTAFERAMAH